MFKFAIVSHVIVVAAAAAKKKDHAPKFLRGIIDNNQTLHQTCNTGADICTDSDEGGLPVLGHKSPDTDAVAGAIIRAWELRVTNQVNTGEPVCATPYVNTDELNRETEFVLDYFNIDSPDTISELKDMTFAVVDTNNIQELTEDYTESKVGREQQLHSIVDHHLVTGTLKSNAPIEWDNRVMASTGSILYQRAISQGLDIPGDGCELNIAGLMLATILSDTLVFRSPTTTQLDIDTAKALGPMAGIEDIYAFGEQMIDAKSNIDGLSGQDIVTLDSKLYDFIDPTGGTISDRVSVFETSRPEFFTDVVEDVSTASDVQLLKDYRVNPITRAVLFFLIDVIEERAVFVPNSNEYATDLVLNAFPDAEVTNDANGVEIIVIPGVISRKKQIVPALTSAALVTEYSGFMPDEVGCLKYINGDIECPDDDGRMVKVFSKNKAVTI